jgi:class 3 adenylate cyclase
MRPRDLLAGAAAVLIATLAVLAPGPRGGIAGLSTDTLFWLRDRAFGPRHSPAEARIAVILIDEATYDLPPFKGVPKDLWTPQFGEVIAAIDAAKPAAIGFDILLPTSLAKFQPDNDVGFRAALHAAAADGRLVMAKLADAGRMTMPANEQVMLVGPRNIRAVNTNLDADGVVRSVPLSLALLPPRTGSEATFTPALAARAGMPPERAAAPDLQLNFDGGYPYPTYSFADIDACAAAHDAAFFDTHFHDRVVLIGTGLDIEDRAVTSRRFINPPELLTGEHCTTVLQPAGAPPPARVTMPAVFINATAVDNLLRNEALRALDLPARAAFVAVAATIAAGLALAAGLGAGLAGLAVLLAAVTALATVLFQHALTTPLIEALAASVLTFALLLGYRFLIADQDKRRIRRMFDLYLAPAVIERMVAAGTMPELGGERRTTTFFFSDIEGFTTLTETADPQRLAAVLNGYFDGVCDVVLAQGGLVIEFMGDGVLAMFGAPDTQPDHAARALATARGVSRFSETYRASGTAQALGLGRTRIGIHSGDALVGNIGASRRLKYAALGDVVNTASRLEGLNKFFHTAICISDVVRAAAEDADARPVGDIVLKGRTQPLAVDELLAAGGAADPYVVEYCAAYALLRAGDPAAVPRLQALAAARPDDGVVAFHLSRAVEGTIGTVIRMDEK